VQGSLKESGKFLSWGFLSCELGRDDSDLVYLMDLSSVRFFLSPTIDSYLAG